MMTEKEALRKQAVRKTRQARMSSVAWISTLALSFSLLLFAGLWIQMAHGNDPVLAVKEERPVIKKRIVVIKRKVVSPAPSSSIASYGSSSAGSASGGSSSGSYSPAPAYTPPPTPVVSQPS